MSSDRAYKAVVSRGPDGIHVTIEVRRSGLPRPSFVESGSSDVLDFFLVLVANLAWIVQRPLWIGRAHLVRAKGEGAPKLKERFRTAEAAHARAGDLRAAVKRDGAAVALR